MDGAYQVPGLRFADQLGVLPHPISRYLAQLTSSSGLWFVHFSGASSNYNTSVRYADSRCDG